jgi:hypothetical protein
MSKIIVGFSKSKLKFPIGSWAIRAYQGTPFSHTYIRVESKRPDRSDHILHASEGIIQHMSGTQFDKKHQVVYEYEIDIPEEKFMELKNAMHELSGANYSVMQNLGIVLVDFMAIFGKHIKNPWQKGWNCSEFVMDMLKLVFPGKYDHIDSNTVTPKQLRNMLKEVY